MMIRAWLIMKISNFVADRLESRRIKRKVRSFHSSPVTPQ